VFSWGWGVHGQLGHGNPEDNCTPKDIKALQLYRIVMVTAGSTHTVVLTAEVILLNCNINNNKI